MSIDDEQIAIRSIQNFLYCPHRWGMMEIDCSWEENYYVVRANFLHSKVHSASEFSAKGKQVYTSVHVWNDEWKIHGVLDTLERDGNKWRIVEYKPTMPKGREYNVEDAMQVFAQKICVDSIFNTSCQCCIYYGDTKRRIVLPFEEEGEYFTQLLTDTLAKMRSCLLRGEIPPISKDRHCSGCSMKDQCMPKRRQNIHVQASVMKAMEE